MFIHFLTYMFPSFSTSCYLSLRDVDRTLQLSHLLIVYTLLSIYIILLIGLFNSPFSVLFLLGFEFIFSFSSVLGYFVYFPFLLQIQSAASLIIVAAFPIHILYVIFVIPQRLESISLSTLYSDSTLRLL